jgi:hypothetical protein
VSPALTALLDVHGSTDDVGGYRMLSADRSCSGKGVLVGRASVDVAASASAPTACSSSRRCRRMAFRMRECSLGSARSSKEKRATHVRASLQDGVALEPAFDAAVD